MTGACVQKNGDVIFGIRAPEAREVSVILDGLTTHRANDVDILELERTGGSFPEARMTLQRTEEGVYEGILKKKDLEGYYGPLCYAFLVDGARVLHPWGRMAHRNGQNVNVVEIPDPEFEEVFQIQKVPHGSVSLEWFWSDVRKGYAPCLVYTPPGYENGTETYPAVYLQHGGGEDETGWVSLGMVAQMMDNLIAAGKARPAVIIMNNTVMGGIGAETGETGKSRGEILYGGIERLIVRECMPCMEEKYRLRRDKWGRAIAGLSQGSMQTSFIGFSHPELFGYLGMFSSSLRCRHYWDDYRDNPHLKTMNEHPEDIEKEYRILYRGVGEQERNTRPWHKEDDEYLARQGVDQFPCYHRTIHPVMCHEWGCFRRSMYEFMQLVFQTQDE